MALPLRSLASVWAHHSQRMALRAVMYALRQRGILASETSLETHEGRWLERRSATQNSVPTGDVEAAAAVADVRFSNGGGGDGSSSSSSFSPSNPRRDFNAFVRDGDTAIAKVHQSRFAAHYMRVPSRWHLRSRTLFGFAKNAKLLWGRRLDDVRVAAERLERAQSAASAAADEALKNSTTSDSSVLFSEKSELSAPPPLPHHSKLSEATLVEVFGLALGSQLHYLSAMAASSSSAYPSDVASVGSAVVFEKGALSVGHSFPEEAGSSSSLFGAAEAAAAERAEWLHVIAVCGAVVVPALEATLRSLASSVTIIDGDCVDVDAADSISSATQTHANGMATSNEVSGGSSRSQRSRLRRTDRIAHLIAIRGVLLGIGDSISFERRGGGAAAAVGGRALPPRQGDGGITAQQTPSPPPLLPTIPSLAATPCLHSLAYAAVSRRLAILFCALDEVLVGDILCYSNTLTRRSAAVAVAVAGSSAASSSAGGAGTTVDGHRDREGLLLQQHCGVAELLRAVVGKGKAIERISTVSSVSDDVAAPANVRPSHPQPSNDEPPLSFAGPLRARDIPFLLSVLKEDYSSGSGRGSGSSCANSKYSGALMGEGKASSSSAASAKRAGVPFSVPSRRASEERGGDSARNKDRGRHIGGGGREDRRDHHAAKRRHQRDNSFSSFSPLRSQGLAHTAERKRSESERNAEERKHKNKKKLRQPTAVFLGSISATGAHNNAVTQNSSADASKRVHTAIQSSGVYRTGDADNTRMGHSDGHRHAPPTPTKTKAIRFMRWRRRYAEEAAMAIVAQSERASNPKRNSNSGAASAANSPPHSGGEAAPLPSTPSQAAAGAGPRQGKRSQRVAEGSPKRRPHPLASPATAISLRTVAATILAASDPLEAPTMAALLLERLIDLPPESDSAEEGREKDGRGEGKDTSAVPEVAGGGRPSKGAAAVDAAAAAAVSNSGGDGSVCLPPVPSSVLSDAFLTPKVYRRVLTLLVHYSHAAAVAGREGGGGGGSISAAVGDGEEEEDPAEAMLAIINQQLLRRQGVPPLSALVFLATGDAEAAAAAENRGLSSGQSHESDGGGRAEKGSQQKREANPKSKGGASDGKAAAAKAPNNSSDEEEGCDVEALSQMLLEFSDASVRRGSSSLSPSADVLPSSSSSPSPHLAPLIQLLCSHGEDGQRCLRGLVGALVQVGVQKQPINAHPLSANSSDLSHVVLEEGIVPLRPTLNAAPSADGGGNGHWRVALAVLSLRLETMAAMGLITTPDPSCPPAVDNSGSNGGSADAYSYFSDAFVVAALPHSEAREAFRLMRATMWTASASTSDLSSLSSPGGSFAAATAAAAAAKARQQWMRLFTQMSQSSSPHCSSMTAVRVPAIMAALEGAAIGRRETLSLAAAGGGGATSHGKQGASGQGPTHGKPVVAVAGGELGAWRFVLQSGYLPLIRDLLRLAAVSSAAASCNASPALSTSASASTLFPGAVRPSVAGTAVAPSAGGRALAMARMLIAAEWHHSRSSRALVISERDDLTSVSAGGRERRAVGKKEEEEEKGEGAEGDGEGLSEAVREMLRAEGAASGRSPSSQAPYASSSSSSFPLLRPPCEEALLVSSRGMHVGSPRARGEWAYYAFICEVLAVSCDGTAHSSNNITLAGARPLPPNPFSHHADGQRIADFVALWDCSQHSAAGYCLFRLGRM